MRFRLLFSVFPTVALIAAAPAHAQGLLGQQQASETQETASSVPAAPRLQAGSVFEVPRVSVRAEAENATTAQQIARDQGRRRAMDILLRRLTAEEDWVYLPRLMSGQAAPAAGGAGTLDDGPMPVEPDGGIGDGAGPPSAMNSSYGMKQAVDLNPGRLPSMEDGFSVYDEKSSPTTYSAKISYRFKADEVRSLLKRAGIPYSESQTRMALVIPVLETNEGSYLWETNNPWARAWLSRSLTNELTPMRLPRGDETDMELLSVAEATGFDQQALGRVAERYGVSQVVIAHGFLDIEDGEYRLRARLRDGYLGQSGREAANYDVTNSSALYDDTAGFGSEGVLIRTSGEQPGRTLLESFYREKTGDFPVLAQRAVENLVAKYAAGWKAQTLVDHSVTREVRANAWFDSLDDMRRIREALDASPSVEAYSVGAISPEGSTLTISVVGAMDQLVADLRQRNVILWTVDNIVWNIATPEKAEAVRDRIRPVDGRLSPRIEEGLGGENPFSRAGEAAGDAAADTLGDFSPPSERERTPRQLRGGDEDTTPRNLFGNGAQGENDADDESAEDE